MTERPIRAGIMAALRDIAIVVLSILIAFGLDAWWSGQVEQQEVREALRAVQADLSETRTRLEANAAVRDSLMTSVQLLLELTGPQAHAPDGVGLASLIRQFNFTVTLAPVTGAIDAIVTSGQIRSIRNDSLRLALAAWRGNLEDFTEDEDYDVRELQSWIRPYLAQHIPLYSADLPSGTQPFREDYVSLLRDLEFRNLVAVRRYRLRQIRLETDILLSHIATAQRLIDASLK